MHLTLMTSSWLQNFYGQGQDSENSHVTKNSFYEAAPIMNRVKRRGNSLAPLFLARLVAQAPEEEGKSPFGTKLYNRTIMLALWLEIAQALQHDETFFACVCLSAYRQIFEMPFL